MTRFDGPDTQEEAMSTIGTATRKPYIKRPALRLVWEEIAQGLHTDEQLERLNDALMEAGGFVHGQGYLLDDGRTQHEALYDNLVAALRGERDFWR